MINAGSQLVIHDGSKGSASDIIATLRQKSRLRLQAYTEDLYEASKWQNGETTNVMLPETTIKPEGTKPDTFVSATSSSYWSLRNLPFDPLSTLSLFARNYGAVAMIRDGAEFWLDRYVQTA